MEGKHFHIAVSQSKGEMNPIHQSINNYCSTYEYNLKNNLSCKILCSCIEKE